MKAWQLQDAKARLSELVKRAAAEGPQNITVHGREVAVVLSRDDYERLRRPKVSFVEFMRRSPWVGVKLDIRRSRSRARKVAL